MKKFLFFIISFFIIVSQCLAAEISRYFLQKPTDVVSSVSYGNNMKSGYYAQRDDAKIYFEVYGKGEPVLVLHGGIVGSIYEMGRFIDELSKNYFVIAPSTRGHGKSEIGLIKISYEQKAKDMLTVVDAVTDKPFVILGFGDGAYTAYKMATMYPDRVKKVIAIGARERIPQSKKFYKNKVEDLERQDTKFFKQQRSLWPKATLMQAYWDAYYNFYNELTVSKNIFYAIKCPVLLIVGEEDIYTPLDTVLAAYKMIPNSSLAVISGASHRAFVDNFEAVWASVKPFLLKN